ncbi:hypothetical protein VPH35_051190 [Triticum aestivum]
MAARPVVVEHSVILDRSLEIENMLPRTLRIFKDRLHHHHLMRVILLVEGVVARLNMVLIYVLQIRIHCSKEEGTTFLALEIHRTCVGHGEYSSSKWYLAGRSEERG